MPESDLAQDPDIVLQMRTGSWNVEAMRRTARRFRVTPTAAATRALRLGFMGPRNYSAWKSAWDAYQAAHPPRPSFAIVTPRKKLLGVTSVTDFARIERPE
jgi:Zn-dependent peptidase ImmA (M78 family)